MKQNDQVESKYVLDVVREKLLNSLNALEKEDYAGDIILQSAKRPLSLNAVAEGPKLRLLWTSFQQVEEEAGIVFNFLFSLFAICTCYVMLFCYIWNFDNLACNKYLNIFWLSILGYHTLSINVKDCEQVRSGRYASLQNLFERNLKECYVTIFFF